MSITTHPEIFQKLTKRGRVALIYHIQITDKTAYNSWCSKSRGLLESMRGRRLFHISVDPVPREGLIIDEIIIDEYPSSEVALDFIEATQIELFDSCHDVTVLAIQPEPHIKLGIVRAIALLMHFFKGIHDRGTPSTNWKASNIAVWPDENQMSVARGQDLDRPLLVYNLNKIKEVALYHGTSQGGKQCSGEEAYKRYSKIAGAQPCCSAASIGNPSSVDCAFATSYL